MTTNGRETKETFGLPYQAGSKDSRNDSSCQPRPVRANDSKDGNHYWAWKSARATKLSIIKGI